MEIFATYIAAYDSRCITLGDQSYQFFKLYHFATMMHHYQSIAIKIQRKNKASVCYHPPHGGEGTEVVAKNVKDCQWTK